ncbi:MAG TPA: hypothetical protein PLT36_02020 [Erysipelotrichaceae bacterium]|jgi:hypothetical protein|nr:hypothetical protein [Erysipelotrichia bacterium]HPX32262.1 hypothetical protein [Erysipelotrichaceae bacterium]HQA84773.1 hypothetical protein [Erysipelotrichaceae bacterium]
MEQKNINNYQKAEKTVSWLNLIAVILAIVAFILRKQYFIYLMSLSLTLLLIVLVIILHLVRDDDEEKTKTVFYHLIALYLILTICSFFTSAKASNYNSFSYVFLHSILVGFLMLIAIQFIFDKKVLLISILGFILVFALALFQINIVLNIVLALVMGAVIFFALTKLMKPAGIYGVIFGVINLAIAIVLLIKPMEIIVFYGHIIVNFAIVALFYAIPVLAKNKKVEEKAVVEKQEEIVKVEEKAVSSEEEKTKAEAVTKDKDLQNRNRWIIKKYSSLPLDKLMKSPVDALWGVSANDAKLLKEAFNIKTVEDLATNKFFNWAKEIVEEAEKE